MKKIFNKSREMVAVRGDGNTHYLYSKHELFISNIENLRDISSRVNITETRSKISK